MQGVYQVQPQYKVAEAFQANEEIVVHCQSCEDEDSLQVKVKKERVKKREVKRTAKMAEVFKRVN